MKTKKLNKTNIKRFYFSYYGIMSHSIKSIGKRFYFWLQKNWVVGLARRLEEKEVAE